MSALRQPQRCGASVAVAVVEQQQSKLVVEVLQVVDRRERHPPQLVPSASMNVNQVIVQRIDVNRLGERRRVRLCGARHGNLLRLGVGASPQPP